MRKQSTILCRALVLMLACITLLCACAKKAPKLDLENDAFRGKNANGDAVAYQKAPVTYRATSALMNEAVYLATGYLSHDIPLYAIENVDPALLLTDEGFDLYHSEAYSLPTLSEMKPCAISVCTVGSNSATELERLDETDREAISNIVKLLETEASYPQQALLGQSPTETFELLFHSEEYPALYYVLEYWRYDTPVSFAEGDAEITVEKGVVYDREARRFYVIGKQLEDSFINS
jgi:hypothetical protein